MEILYRLQYCLQLKNSAPQVACKEKADTCKFLAVQKFVKGVIVLTRVGTFSVIMIIDRSRTPGSLQPLGSFLSWGVCGCVRVCVCVCVCVGGGGVLPYITYTSMCRPTGLSF